ncbi:MAG: response regulator transcription factor [Candidatus Eisenbacteria bacterium]|nr:response regulator transcription factor [Candidatus Eisenbacteria bacterium]
MSSRAPIRVLLADDHPLVRAGVRKVLEQQPAVSIVGEAGDGDEALRLLAELEPDLLVLDLNMPNRDGFAVLREARDAAPGVRILVLTMHSSVEYVSRAVREGADGYLLKDTAVRDLAAAIESVTAGRPYYSEPAQRALADSVRRPADAAPPLERLTAREREVLAGVARGRTTKEIAAEFNISTRTVETHRAAIMRKLEIRSVALLTQFAIRAGLIEPPPS